MGPASSPAVMGPQEGRVAASTETVSGRTNAWVGHQNESYLRSGGVRGTALR